MKVRTRFAPSPTGHLHIGNIRTALYSWLFSRKHGGVFILRIENSDNYRSTYNSVEDIVAGLTWLGLNWDEGPYFQTNRLKRYRSVIDDMIQNRTAYKCYCSSERLQLLRMTQIRNGEKPKYDGYCRINKCIVSKKTNNILSMPYVVRFRNPQHGTVQFHDQIRGVITVCNKELDDVILCRADGSPTYNFCVVVDDMDMNITHVIRGEEHISNTPRQINILKSLQASIPIYAHVSMILDHDKKKLSKRHGIAGIMQYRNNGFLPEAILNYLVRLGWSYGDQEIFSIDQMKQYFDIGNVGKSASTFNLKKLLWYNHYYINHLPVDRVVAYLSWYIHKNNININNSLKLVDIVKLLAKRSRTLKEIVSNFYSFYKNFDISKDKMAQDFLSATDIILLTFVRNKLSNVMLWSLENIQFIILNAINELDIDMHQMGALLRIVLTGTNQSPSLNNIIYIIGKSCVLERIDRAIYVCKLKQ